jgi:hypothetical protein
MTRLWRTGAPIQMGLDTACLPERFIWQGRSHPVAGIANHWRVDIGWWRIHIRRDYFKLYTQTGLLAVVYCDLDNHRWYLQRLYD